MTELLPVLFFPQEGDFGRLLQIIEWIDELMHMIGKDDVCWTSKRPDDMENFNYYLMLIERYLAEMACDISNVIIRQRPLTQTFDSSFCPDGIPTNLIAPLKFQRIGSCLRKPVFGESRNYILLHGIGILLKSMTRLPLSEPAASKDEPTGAHSRLQPRSAGDAPSAVGHASAADGENDFVVGGHALGGPAINEELNNVSNLYEQLTEVPRSRSLVVPQTVVDASSRLDELSVDSRHASHSMAPAPPRLPSSVSAASAATPNAPDDADAKNHFRPRRLTRKRVQWRDAKR
jgi:hypothetical protein